MNDRMYFYLFEGHTYRLGMGGRALVPARPQPMVVGGWVLGEDGRGRALTGPIPITEEDMLAERRKD
jgi:hypothetical protein